MNFKTIGKWLFLLGLLVAIVAALFQFSADWLTWVLILIGIVCAFTYFDYNDVVNAGIRFLVLYAVAGAFGGLFGVVGTYLTGIFMAVLGFYAPILLTMLVIWFFKKHIMK